MCIVENRFLDIFDTQLYNITEGKDNLNHHRMFFISLSGGTQIPFLCHQLPWEPWHYYSHLYFPAARYYVSCVCFVLCIDDILANRAKPILSSVRTMYVCNWHTYRRHVCEALMLFICLIMNGLSFLVVFVSKIEDTSACETREEYFSWQIICTFHILHRPNHVTMILYQPKGCSLKSGLSWVEKQDLLFYKRCYFCTLLL